MEQKICGKCKLPKDVEQYRQSSKSSDGLQSWCNSCFSEYDRDRYNNGDKVRKDRNRERTRNKSREFIWFYLKLHPCEICGEKDPLVLEFDHLDPDTKDMNVSEMFSYSVKRIQEEIEKCRVLCANCHRRHTVEQRGTWRGYYNLFDPSEEVIPILAKYGGFKEGSTLLDMIERA